MAYEGSMGEAERKVHMPVLTWQRRGFSNLSVPPESLPFITSHLPPPAALLMGSSAC